eukprot:m.178883 g.178883  ORF g.178883 m.178883 type:complete len:334 (+) comp15472_c0_seq23:4573-5574(+)
MSGPTFIAIICPTQGPVVDALPSIDGVEIILGNTLETFTEHPNIDKVECLVFVAAGGDLALVEPVFTSLPKCAWVHSFFAGVDKLGPFINKHLSADTAGKAIPLTNGKGAFSDSLAEWCMTAILHFNKQMPKIQQNKKEKKWEKFVMDTVAGKTLGIVGFGHIGQTTAKMAKQAFGMKVIALRSNPKKTSDFADQTLGPDQKLELFKTSDYVVCSLPGTADTENFCGKSEFDAMKKNAVFISVGRGLAVDEDALVGALKSGSIGGAALDVFKNEPLAEKSELWSCENLIITSHNADFTEDYFKLGWTVFQENLTKYLAGERPLATEIDKSAGY